MKYRLQCQPTYSAVEVDLQPGERVVAEAGAMAWMSNNIKTETAARGGMLAGLKRKLLSGESFFQNTYSAEGGPGQIAFAPGSPGHIVAHPLEGGELYLEKGAYLASTEGITCDTKFDGLKGFFNEGLFVLRVTGQGTLFFNGYGDIQAVDVDGQYTVDNGYAVAWEPSLQYQLTRGRKIRSFLFSDQLLLRFSGQGRVWVQSRSPQSLASWAHPFRPTDARRSGGGGKIFIGIVLLLMVLFCGCCGCGGILMALMDGGADGVSDGVAEVSQEADISDGNPRNPGAETTYRFAGEWTGSGYRCWKDLDAEGEMLVQQEAIRITQRGNQVTAIKVTGDSCVLAGEKTWEGMIRGGEISGSLYGRDRDSEQLKAYRGNLTIVNSERIVTADGQLVFTRVRHATASLAEALRGRVLVTNLNGREIRQQFNLDGTAFDNLGNKADYTIDGLVLKWSNDDGVRTLEFKTVDPQPGDTFMYTRRDTENGDVIAGPNPMPVIAVDGAVYHDSNGNVGADRQETTPQRSFADALKQLERLGSSGVGNSPSALNERSWEVVRNPFGDPEGYAQALADALKAVRDSREDRNIVNTYGVALYRVGAYEAARVTLERNLQRWDDPLGGSAVYDRVFLAMAYSQLGERENANEALRTVHATMEREGRADEELLLFVDEAEYVLGVAAGSESQ